MIMIDDRDPRLSVKILQNKDEVEYALAFLRMRYAQVFKENYATTFVNLQILDNTEGMTSSNIFSANTSATILCNVRDGKIKI